MKKSSSKKTSSKAVKNGAPKRAKTPARTAAKTNSKSSLSKNAKSGNAASGSRKSSLKSPPTHRETLRAPEMNAKSKKDFRRNKSQEVDNTEVSEQPFEKVGRRPQHSGKPKAAKSGHNTQFADEQTIPKDDMDVVADESVENSQEKGSDEEGPGPTQYHRAEDLEERKKEASRKPKGHAQDAPPARRENQNTHRRG